MDIISKLKHYLGICLNSTMLRGMSAFLVIVLFVFVLQAVLLVNTTKQLVFSNKKSALLNEAETIASSMNSNSVLTEFLSTEVMQVLGVNASESVTITDSDGIVLYSSKPSITTGSVAIFPEVVSALHGNDTFRSVYKDKVFFSYCAIPVMSSGKIIGSVMVTDFDNEQAGVLNAIWTNILELTAIFLVLGVGLFVLFAVLIVRKNIKMLSAIHAIQEGNYAYRAEVTGKDEFAVLTSAFNQLAERLQENEQVRRQFVSDASHELRTPLAAIRLLSDSIVQNDMDNETIKEFVRDISGEADRLTRMTTKLLNLSALDSRPGESIEKSAVNLGKCCKKAVRMLTPLAGERQAKIEESSEDDCYVYATEDDIFQIVVNLSENALKYSGENGAVRLIAYTQSEMAYLIVDDNGVGIPETELEKIFDRFYRVDKARSRAAGGTGLGLSIVRDTVERYGGTVTASNRPQGGARFTVCLPAYVWEGEK